MTTGYFLDRNQPPEQDLIHKVIGKEVLPVWQDLLAYLSGHFPDFEPEMIYYNPQHGWGLRYRKESQQLCILFPERGAVTALITLNPEEEEAAQEQINYFNTRFRQLLNQPSAIPQGRWMWVRLEDHTDFVGFRLLLEIKAG